MSDDREFDRSEEIHRGREAFSRREWKRAHEALTRSDRNSPLEAGDLERLATCAYLLGKADDFVRLCDRAHRAHLADDDRPGAARCAFWAGLSLLLGGQMGPASGWLSRARRLIEDVDCVEHGYLLLPEAEKLLRSARYDEVFEEAAEAARLGDRFEDADLVALARHLQGRARIRQGHMGQGFELLDEAMLASSSGGLSPIVTGMVYCSVIAACREAREVDRARAWTEALSQWCDLQPQMVAFTSTCLVHRAGILRLQGHWLDAMEEADRARRHSERHHRDPPAAAFYERAEVHRLRGEYDEAEAAYREASRLGAEPQPGLGRLRLAQGNVEAAAAGVRRALEATSHPLKRADLLPARIEILVAADDVAGAEAACEELEEISARFESGPLRAMALEARGRVRLAGGDAEEAIASLGEARAAWRAADLPYATARVRVLMAGACRMLGDEDGYELELQAARTVFEKLGAGPDLDRMEAVAGTEPDRRPHGLTPRELEVLREVATGKTNRAIADELFVSERTIERHLSNLFKKLDVESRTAAASFAYEHGLV